MDQVTRYRTIWISDVHLGTRACNTTLLLDFLQHNDVIQKLLRKARKGTRVLYIPGNHDEAARQFVGQNFGDVDVADDCIHETADGRRFLVIHGDQFDVVVRYAKWLAHIGDKAYELLLHTNTALNIVRRRLGFSYWSLSAYMKQRA